jgi:L,D-peptidoglycan transpeptidase YkuD (ErfK/YbiS/YcfS/YnhG family)
MSKMKNSNIIIVSPGGSLSFLNKRYKCALGKSGVTTNKIEGDGATPAGTFPIREVLYRADRMRKPKTGLIVSALKPNDAWSDDPKNIDYNKRVSLPHNGQVERLWRKDDLYNIIVIVGYNDEIVKESRGSAIFLHVAKDGLEQTRGCVALETKDLLQIITSAAPPEYIMILPPRNI